MTIARTLLLVDDDAESRASLQSLIESEGYQAEAVASGEAALKRLGAFSFENERAIRLLSPIEMHCKIELQRQAKRIKSGPEV